MHYHLRVAHPPQGLESLYKAICARYNAEEAKEPQELPFKTVAQRGVHFSGEAHGIQKQQHHLDILDCLDDSVKFLPWQCFFYL